MSNTPVEYAIDGAVGHLVLAQPRTLNALTLEMIIALHDALSLLEADQRVKAIIIRSNSERAFCAGGDMKNIRNYA